MRCECCGQEIKSTLSPEEYNARAIPRLEAIDRLSKKIDFGSPSWRYTSEGKRWLDLMEAQGRDEVAAGL